MSLLRFLWGDGETPEKGCCGMFCWVSASEEAIDPTNCAVPFSQTGVPAPFFLSWKAGVKVCFLTSFPGHPVTTIAGNQWFQRLKPHNRPNESLVPYRRGNCLGSTGKGRSTCSRSPWAKTPWVSCTWHLALDLPNSKVYITNSGLEVQKCTRS